MAVVLVTGGAGYVGSHACKALAEAGHEPVVFDNLATGWRDAVRYGPLIEGDLRDADALAAAFRDARPEAVMHFAALSTVAESARMPDLYWSNNVGGSANLLTAAREAGVGSVVFSSTAAIYGDAGGQILTESDAQGPINVYGRTKLAVEQMLRDFEAAFGMRSVLFRYFNASGADPEARIGEDHRPETHLIPLVLDAADGLRDNIAVFGSDYPTPDGTCIRDYVHVADLARAHVQGLDLLLEGGGSQVLNLGSETGHSVRAVIEAAREVTGRPFDVIEAPRRTGDPARLVSSSRRAQQVLGWRARHTDLHQTIEHAWRWHRTGKFGAR